MPHLLWSVPKNAVRVFLWLIKESEFRGTTMTNWVKGQASTELTILQMETSSWHLKHDS